VHCLKISFKITHARRREKSEVVLRGGLHINGVMTKRCTNRRLHEDDAVTSHFLRVVVVGLWNDCYATMLLTVVPMSYFCFVEYLLLKSCTCVCMLLFVVVVLVVYVIVVFFASRFRPDLLSWKLRARARDMVG